jgi:LysR family transcriptional activator of glutamate synthase operon
MELKYLDTFLTLVDSKSFTEAADKLFISQSSLSKRIQVIEHTAGCKLFTRNTRKVELNYYGQLYFNYAKQIKALESACDQELESVTSGAQGITIGAIPSMNEYHITALLAKFMSETGIHFRIKTATSGKLERMLHDHQCDVAFIKAPGNDYILKQLPYFKDHLVAVLPPKHRLASAKQIHLRDLANENFLLEPENSRPYNLVVKHCEQAGFTPNITYTDGHIDNIMSLVSQGLGCSLLMQQIATDDQIVQIPLAEIVTTTVSLCYDPATRMNNEKAAFLRFFKNHHTEFGQL